MPHEIISARAIRQVGENKNSGEHFANPAEHLAPGDSWIVDGLDWSWAFVVFAEVPGSPEYRVGTNGSVWSCRSGHSGFYSNWRRLNGEPIGDGHIRVCLNTDEGRRRVFIHELVLEAFVGPRPDGMITRHFPDRTPSNNNLWNLHWGTHQENSDDKNIHGTTARGSLAVASKLTEDQVCEIVVASNEGQTLKEIATRYPVHAAVLSRAVAGKSWGHVDAARSTGHRYIRKLGPDGVSEMFRLRAVGWSMRKIAAHLKINSSTVSRTLHGEMNANV